MSKTRNLRLLVAAITLALAGGLATAVAPAASATIAGVPQQAVSTRSITASAVTTSILNSHSGRCLGINSSRDAGIWNCTGGADQTWHWGSANSRNGDYHQIINKKGQCLGVAGGSTANGARIVGWSCLGSGHVDQYWLYSCVWLGEGSNLCVLNNLGTPVNAYSLGGKVIGVSGGSTANGAAAVLWTNTTGPHFHVDQGWYMADI